MDKPNIVSHEQWIEARRGLLAAEKDLTRRRDALAALRQALPWERVDKEYVFDTPRGPRTLAELFDGRSQLLAQHFMLGPGWEEGCKGCSFMADHIDGMNVHLANRDVTLVVVSRAPLAEIERFRRRMGWRFTWVSSHGSEFNYDYYVSFTPEQEARGEVVYNYARGPFECEEMPGVSVFVRNEASEVFHTYSTYQRGVEVMMARTRCWTSCRKAATSATCPSWRGCATTTGMRRPRSETRALGRLLARRGGLPAANRTCDATELARARSPTVATCSWGAASGRSHDGINQNRAVSVALNIRGAPGVMLLSLCAVE